MEHGNEREAGAYGKEKSEAGAYEFRLSYWGRGNEITEQYFPLRLTFVSTDKTLKCGHAVESYLVVFVFVFGTLVFESETQERFVQFTVSLRCLESDWTNSCFPKVVRKTLLAPLEQKERLPVI